MGSCGTLGADDNSIGPRIASPRQGRVFGPDVGLAAARGRDAVRTMVKSLQLPFKLKKQLQEECGKLAVLYAQQDEQVKIHKKSKGAMLIGCVFIAVALFLHQNQPGVAAYIGFGIAALVIPFALFCIWGSKERRAEIALEQITITDQFLDHGLLVNISGRLVHVLDDDGRPVGKGRDPMSKKSYSG
jgi:hypothetical protein